MKKLVLLGAAAVVSLTAVAGGAAAADDREEQIRAAREQLLPAGTAEEAGGPTPQVEVSSPYTAVDPSDAPAPVNIRRYVVTHGDRVRIEFRIQKPKNPATNGSWRKGLSFVETDISVDGNQSAEFFVIGFNNGTGALRGIVDNNTSPPALCQATFRYFAPKEYVLRFDRSCIDDPDTIRVTSAVILDKKPLGGAPGLEDLFDFAPNPSAQSLRFTPEITYSG